MRSPATAPAGSGPHQVRNGQRRLDGIDKVVFGVYACCVTVRPNEAQIGEMFDADVSPDLISKITKSVLEVVRDR